MDRAVRKFVEQHTTKHFPGGGIEVGEFCPGNGTAYRVITVPFDGPMGGGSYGVLGNVDDGYLVVNCNTGQAWLFSGDNNVPVHLSTVKEHLFRGQQPAHCDLASTTALVAYLLRRPCGVQSPAEFEDGYSPIAPSETAGASC